MYDGDKKSDWLPEALENLTHELRRQLESGYRPGDIAILVRKRDEGNIIIRHLEDTVKSDPQFPPFRIVSDASLFLEIHRRSDSSSAVSSLSVLRILPPAREKRQNVRLQP